MGAVKALCPALARAHIERRRGSPEEAAQYCKKDGDFLELGKQITLNQGKRNDLHRLRELVEGGCYNKLTLMQETDAAFRYPQAVGEYVRLSKRAKLQPMNLQLRPWQERLVTSLIQETKTATRTVHWYWEAVGMTGKTTMATYLTRNHNAFYCTGGKTNDICHAYNEEKIVVFDFARSLQEHINYQAIEMLKNGILFSGKYNSSMKIFDPPALVCFANYPPDESKLSADRWNIVNIQ